MWVYIIMYCGIYYIQRGALLQYGEYAAQLPKAIDRVSNILINIMMYNLCIF